MCVCVCASKIFLSIKIEKNLFILSMRDDQTEMTKLISLFLLFIGEDLAIDLISKEVYICDYLSIDKTDESS